MSNKPRILFLDIETKPMLAYAWRAYDENITPDQIIDKGGLLCFGAKFLDEDSYYFFSEWEDGHEDMVDAAYALISEADAVVTYNGDRFDLPKLMGEFILEGYAPPPPVTSIDVYKTVRKLGLPINKLVFAAPLLGAGEKTSNEGFMLWRKVMEEDPKARKQMEKYCIRDVAILARLYKIIRPYIKNHPHLREEGPDVCGACGSTHVHSRGFRRTRAYKIQRLQCQTCGSWQDGKRSKV